VLGPVVGRPPVAADLLSGGVQPWHRRWFWPWWSRRP